MKQNLIDEIKMENWVMGWWALKMDCSDGVR